MLSFVLLRLRCFWSLQDEGYRGQLRMMVKSEGNKGVYRMINTVFGPKAVFRAQK